MYPFWKKIVVRMYKEFLSNSRTYYVDEFGKYSRRNTSSSSEIEREGYFFSNTKEVDDEYVRYLLERGKNND